VNRLAIVLVAVCLLTPGCVRRPAATSLEPPAEGTAALDQLLVAMHARLDLMHTVARVKWNTKAPIFAPERERALLDDVVSRGRSHQLDPKRTRAFFVAQMEAAKIVQQEDFERWTAAQQPPFDDVPDLAVLRKEIDTLNGTILESLGAANTFLETDEGQQRLEGRALKMFAGFSAPARQAALKPLRRE
jgi:chorismate mutase-like protein